MQNLQVFNNAEFGQVRVLEKGGEPWFVGKDVADILGYEAARNAIASHVDDDDKLTHQISASGQNRNMTIINESGLYSLILSSKLPQAKQFKRWVTSEVLPALRKTGFYEISKKQSQEERLHIMAMNAKSRMAQTYLKLADVDTLSKEYKNILVSKASEVLAGEQIIPLPQSLKKVYSAKEIGDMFGISANKVGRIANKHNLKVPKYGEYRRDKSQHSVKEVDTWVYFDTAIPVFKQILSTEVA